MALVHSAGLATRMSEGQWGPALHEHQAYLLLAEAEDRCAISLVPNFYCEVVADFEVRVVCRTCGPRAFRVCGEDLGYLFDALEERRAWPAYCSEPGISHEIVAIAEVLPCPT